MRGAFIPNFEGNECHIAALGEEHPTRFIEPEMLLVPKRRQASACLEAPVKSRSAHASQLREVLDAERPGVVLPQPSHGFSDLGEAAIKAGDLLEEPTLRTAQQVKQDLAFQKRSQNGDLVRVVIEAQQAEPGIEQPVAREPDIEASRAGPRQGIGDLVHEVGDNSGIEAQAQRKIRDGLACSNDFPHRGQVYRRYKSLSLTVAEDLIP